MLDSETSPSKKKDIINCSETLIFLLIQNHFQHCLSAASLLSYSEQSKQELIHPNVAASASIRASQKC